MMSLAAPKEWPAASLQQYQDHHSRCNTLRKSLESPGHGGSPGMIGFETYTSLALWGWRNGTKPSDRLETFENADALGTIVKLEPGIRVQWYHDAKSAAGQMTVNGTYPDTYAHYHNVYWPKLGVIVSVSNKSPKEMVEDRKSTLHRKYTWEQERHRLPCLQHWSDVVYLTWKNEAARMGANIRNLRWVFRRLVTNEETIRVLTYVLRSSPSSGPDRGKAPRWPDKKSITRDDAGFDALLDTPSIRSIVQLLLDHRSTLGLKRIRSVTAYQEIGNTGYVPTLKVAIEDYSPTEALVPTAAAFKVQTARGPQSKAKSSNGSKAKAQFAMLSEESA